MPQVKEHPLEQELISAKIRRGTIQKAKVIASLEGQSIADYIGFLVDKAYDATMHNRGRKVPVKAKK